MKKYAIHSVIQLLFTLLVGFGLVACQSGGNTPDPVTGQISATARNNQVNILRGGDPAQAEPLIAPNNGQLRVGDGIDVDEAGYAQLVFPDLFVVEIMRDGEIVVQQAQLDENNAIVNLSQVGGAILNDFDADAALNRRFVIETEFARITATGTQFLIAREAQTPLEWIVALDAGPQDLYVYADGITKTVTSNEARWVSPIGEPSPAFKAEMGNMSRWVQNLREGTAVQELGEVIWQMPNELSSSADLPAELKIGEPFVFGNTAVTLQPGGTYRRLQCDGDGLTDIYVENGTLLFDLRPVTARVRAFDVTVQNYVPAGQNSLRGYNPAGPLPENMLGETRNQFGEKSWEVLSLRSPAEPIHFAELRLEQGCFLGLAMPAPDASPQPAVPDIPLLPTRTPSPTSPANLRDSAPPSAPEGLAPNGTQYSCRPGDGLNIAFSWQAAQDASDIFQYQTEAEFRPATSHQAQLFQINNWAAATRATQTLNCIPGELRWRVRAVDNAQNEGDWSAWASFVVAARENQLPTFVGQPSLVTNGNFYYEQRLTAFDPDGDRLSITAVQLPLGLVLTDRGDGTAVLSGSLAAIANQTGTTSFPVTLRVSDNYGGATTQTFTISLPVISEPDEPDDTDDHDDIDLPTSPPPNQPPVFTTVPPTEITAQQTYQYTAQAYDPEGSSLQATFLQRPAWLTGELQANGFLLYGTPGMDDVGEHEVILSVCDAQGACTQQAFVIKVNPIPM